jgi:hypothetical protein
MHCKLTVFARTLLFAGIAFWAVPAIAAADFLVEPFFAWSRNPPQPAGSVARWHPGGGVAVDWTAGKLMVGGEVGYASGFFDPPQDVFDLIQSSHLLTVNGAAGITRAYAARRRLYPYATAGFGLLRQQARDRAGAIDVTRNDPAVNAGGGLRLLLKDYVGVRGDVRYFRSLENSGDGAADLAAALPALGFWRVSAAVVLRFGD